MVVMAAVTKINAKSENNAGNSVMMNINKIERQRYIILPFKSRTFLPLQP